MPELPDITVYIERLEAKLTGETLDGVRIRSPFLVRTVTPRPDAAIGRRFVGFHRIGKRIVMGLEDDLFLVLHLMIAGRLRWREAGVALPGRLGLAAFDLSAGSLLLTEAGTRKRASLHVVEGRRGLAAHDPGGLEVLESTPEAFHAALTRENHTLKRTLTDPRLLSGIGNAYSDEILHRARLSPTKLSLSLDADESRTLHAATREVLLEWTDRLRREVGDAFPEKVTAFHDEMAVHGRFGKPCPACGTTVQRIRHAANETNYCPGCQTGGRLLADRALSRLLRKDWPRSVEELESLRGVPEPPATGAPSGAVKRRPRRTDR